jgi:hypothetical protein
VAFDFRQNSILEVRCALQVSYNDKLPALMVNCCPLKAARRAEPAALQPPGDPREYLRRWPEVAGERYGRTSPYIHEFSCYQKWP